MNVAGSLEFLAERHGIESDFVDALGNIQQTSQATKRALLAALGVDAGDAAAVHAALDALDAAEWDRMLPPVVVARQARIRVPVVAPHATGDIVWRLTLESGEERIGTVAFDDLTLIATQKRGQRLLERRELPLPADTAFGYHRLRCAPDGEPEMTLIVSPGRCWLPPAIESGGRLSGLAVQLYLLRSHHNWGIGDFTDLQTLVRLVAQHGADVIGLNPLHQMFFDLPEHASPYSPASRLLLNVLNIDVSAIPEYATSVVAQARVEGAEFQARLRGCREATLVDYSGVSALKLDVLRLLFVDFDQTTTERQAEFAQFRSGSSQTMQRTFTFLALREFFAARDPALAAWQTWPPEYRHPESAAVADFARDHAADVTFIAWLQWLADAQLAAAAQAGGAMRVGLYRDLAVGADPAGAETWSNQDAVVAAARVGAPPDIVNRAGQNWDLPPYHPQALRGEAYRSFIELVRANMRHAGGLRIDHVMALQHLYWIPAGAAPPDGAYVRYPLDDLIGILALESVRAKCLVVGEDLGTVPDGFRERMTAANVLSYRVLFFERESDADAAFISPEAYPPLALAVLGSHDLPTLRAWWAQADIRLRDDLHLIDAAAADAERKQRRRDRDTLVAALHDAGALAAPRAANRDSLFIAAHSFLAATASALAIAQIDDVTDETDPVNVPTTSDEHPNWRRRLSRTLEELPADARFAALFDVFAKSDRLRT